ncbi:potassium voltage-gated channel protein Shaw-like [Dreissena polymorpha]|nr:potassium voltage-gated channel protein Shaw-like [Dreissena polymorpha]
MFHAILNYMRTGELHLPSYICGPAAKLELDFWGVPEQIIQPCCWINYNEGNSTKDALKRLDSKHEVAVGLLKANQTANYNVENEVRCLPSASENWREKGWRFLNRTNSSKAARLFGYTATLMAVLSIFSFMADTTKEFDYFEKSTHPSEVTNNQSNANVYVNESNITTLATQTAASEPHMIRMKHPVLIIIDMICVVYFILEYLARLAFSPDKLQYARSPLAVIDLLAIVTDIIDTVLRHLQPELQESVYALRFIGILRLFRILTIFRVVRHSEGLWILIYIFKASFKQLTFLVWFMIIGILIFSSLVYFVDDRDKFTSIPGGFWWAVITMTTVGYGDYYPVTVLGKIVGSLCAMAGVLMIGLSVPSLANHFQAYYRHTQLVMHMDKLKLVSQTAHMKVPCMKTSISLIKMKKEAARYRKKIIQPYPNRRRVSSM